MARVVGWKPGGGASKVKPTEWRFVGEASAEVGVEDEPTTIATNDENSNGR